MSRFGKGLTATIFLVIFILSAPFVNFWSRTEFALANLKDQTELSIYVTRVGVNFNLHGGNSDSYKFLFTKGLSRIQANQIDQFFFNYAEMPVNFARGSELIIQLDEKECQLTIKLTYNDGTNFPLNGVHREKYCGQQYLK
jgi:hypothetical protein